MRASINIATTKSLFAAIILFLYASWGGLNPAYAVTSTSQIGLTDKDVKCTWYKYDWQEGDKFRKWCSDRSNGTYIEVDAVPTARQKKEWEEKWARDRRLKSGKALSIEDRRYKVRNAATIKETTRADRALCLSEVMGGFGRHEGKLGYQNKCLFDVMVKCSDQSEVLSLSSAPGDMGIALFCENPEVQ
jgi:hypothetical protein